MEDVEDGSKKTGEEMSDTEDLARHLESIAVLPIIWNGCDIMERELAMTPYILSDRAGTA